MMIKIIIIINKKKELHMGTETTFRKDKANV